MEEVVVRVALFKGNRLSEVTQPPHQVLFLSFDRARFVTCFFYFLIDLAYDFSLCSWLTLSLAVSFFFSYLCMANSKTPGVI